MKTSDALESKTQPELIEIISHQDNEIENLKEKLRLALHARFGRRSEKFPDDRQADMFDEAKTPDNIDEITQTEEQITISSHKRKKTGRRPLPDYLPRVKKYYDLTDDEKVCECGCALTHIGDETSEQLEFIPATVQVIQHIRLKYACRSCEDTIKTSAAPKQPIPKSIATSSLLSHILVSKYCDHLPLYRQESILQRHGIDISRGTLSNWVIKCYHLLSPLVKLMVDNITGYDVAYADETVIQVLKEPDRPPDRKSYMWLFHGGPPGKHCYIYQYEETRARHIPYEFFEDFSGYLHIDGYAGYNALTSKPVVTAVGCFAHARRKFIEVTKLSKNDGLAHWAVQHIAKLYKIEKEAKEKSLPTDAIYHLRRKKSKPLLDKLHQWLNEHISRVAPKSKLAGAISYTLNQWEHLVAYIEDGRLEIDNNSSERAIKPFVIGRKNWLFSDRPEGAKASAIIYSLIETCKAHSINPYDYFRYVLAEIVHANTVEQLEALLPYEVDCDSLKNL